MNSDNEIRAHQTAQKNFTHATFEVKQAFVQATGDISNPLKRSAYRAARDTHETARLALLEAQKHVTVLGGAINPPPFGSAGPAITDTVRRARAGEAARYDADKALHDALEN
ncbi:hypothetical protein [Rhodococcoides yunnanense]|uniref:hypothetical protein n=1 Tax=Rhodococcoides yunnanense TaxID=278209 RepID=UPI0009343EE5|nr:hypothetical protein [Rhodococcus yunnanensis]